MNTVFDRPILMHYLVGRVNSGECVDLARGYDYDVLAEEEAMLRQTERYSDMFISELDANSVRDALKGSR